MADTNRREPPKWYRHENTAARAITRKRYRAKVRIAIQKGQYDALPVPKGTEGWITW